ncbi:unnamed protein product [Adineta ricciae]|uniref:Secreted protein n=1 Tax=Adineta ricciae TaxID=249248 RepID=A0A813PYD1_ADIRI|nr:unnamed protein product [Adineta ricciae]CAF0918776.1 unnamed protein product [Adineta ricciae]
MIKKFVILLSLVLLFVMYTCGHNTSAIISCQRWARVYDCPSYNCALLSVVHGDRDYSGECYVLRKPSKNAPKSSLRWYKLILRNHQRGFGSSGPRFFSPGPGSGPIGTETGLDDLYQ